VTSRTNNLRAGRGWAVTEGRFIGRMSAHLGWANEGELDKMLG
jgi:hypothetical protein